MNLPPVDSADPFDTEYIRWVRDKILETVDEHSRAMDNIRQNTRECVEIADNTIRQATAHPRATDDMVKAEAIERLQALRDELRELF